MASSFERWMKKEDGGQTALWCCETKDSMQEAFEAADPMTMVREFHDAMGCAHRRGKTPQFADEHDRLDFMLEELAELSRAIRTRDFVAAVDALADLAYFVYGTADRWGVDLTDIIAEVHASNMTKEPRLESGKIVKGEAYVPPRVAEKLAEQGWEERC